MSTEIKEYYCRRCGAKDSGIMKFIERNLTYESLMHVDGIFEGGNDTETQDYLDRDFEGVECSECGERGDDAEDVFTVDPTAIKKLKGRRLACVILNDWQAVRKYLRRKKLVNDRKPKEVENGQ